MRGEVSEPKPAASVVSEGVDVPIWDRAAFICVEEGTGVLALSSSPPLWLPGQVLLGTATTGAVPSLFTGIL